MIRQPSAWGQLWADLAERHGVHACGMFTPNWHQPKPSFRGDYYSTWFRMVPHGNERRAVYFPVDGDTAWGMIRNGLEKAGANDLHMKLLLLACIVEHISDWVLRDHR